ncbi:type I-E CRISPR-associated protein Cas6/Cse3/CasE [Streptomyces sp. Y1]|uniref:Type I-E CRISPR-associated protein Cas6/Cse3/CasE n=1 Tax=Streptomyces sp. Y1 TaxID=3238634 RepID=A0AB39TW13_9ACTN
MTPAASLARIQLNTRSRDVQRDLRDATQMHKTLMRLVPDNLGATPRYDVGLLFRVEETDRDLTLLVQATAPLNASGLPADYGRTQIKDLTPMFRALRKGLAVRYRTVVNPVKRERLPLDLKGRRGKLIALTGPDADQWWARRAAEAGLHLTTLHPTPLDSAHPTRPRGDENAPSMRHNLIRYDGTATVTDPEALAAAVLTGIGRAKSYGAGLLSLAPATTS